MVRENEARRVEQYCFSILNPGLIARVLQRHNLTHEIFIHPVIQASSLPRGVVQSFENEMNNTLDANNIMRNGLTLDHVGRTGTINYALYADPRQGIVRQLEQLDGFYRAWVA